MKNEKKTGPYDPEFKKAAGEAALLIRAKQEMTKRMVKHIETIASSAKIALHLKLVLLIKSAEFMRAMAGEVADQMFVVSQQHASVAAADIVAALRFQQEILKKAAERCKAISSDVAMAQKMKHEMLKGVAHDLCNVAGNIAISMSSMAEMAMSNDNAPLIPPFSSIITLRFMAFLTHDGM